MDGPPGKKKKEGLLEELVKNIREELSFMLDQLQWMDPQVRRKGRSDGGDGEEHKGGVQLYAGSAPVDGPTGKKKKEGLVEEMVKNIREEFSLMLDQLQRMDPQVRTRKAGGGDGEEHKGGVQLDARPTPVDGPTGKNKEGLIEEMVKNIREAFSLMLDQIQWIELLLGRNGTLS